MCGRREKRCPTTITPMSSVVSCQLEALKFHGVWLLSGPGSPRQRNISTSPVAQDFETFREQTMADAAKSPADVIDFLTSQHEQIRTLFAETLDHSGKEREQAFIELRRLLAVHETAEEEIVHPRAKRKIPDGDQVVGKRLEEEHEAKAILAKLEEIDVDADEFTEKLKKLRDAVLEHAEHEEQEEFAKLHEELDEKELERLGRAAKLAESIAPTRPHPGVESPAANLFAGPFAAMTDRARDAILGKG